MSAHTDGLLLVDKPAGITSHDVVQLARRAYGEKSIGHLGTLDPFATGLLMLLLGRSTRLATFIVTEPKIYEATIRFGTETDTDDSTGAPSREAPLPPEGAVRAAIPGLTGVFSQVPPAYSAKSVNGTRSYSAARKGLSLDLVPVQIEVAGWEIRDERDDEMDVVITCGTGTYIRALARDLGRAVSSAAHLAALRRVRAGSFTVSEAVSIDDLRAGPPPLLRLNVVATNA